MKMSYMIKKILRKIYHFIGFISLFILFIVPVKADSCSGQTTINTINLKSNLSEYEQLSQTSNFLCSSKQGYNCSYFEALNELLTYYNNNKKTEFPYYTITISSLYLANSSPYQARLVLDYYSSSTVSFRDNLLYDQVGITSNGKIEVAQSSPYNIFFNNNTNVTLFAATDVDGIFYKHYTLMDSNFEVTSNCSYEFSNFYTNSNLVVNSNGNFPKIINLLDFTSWSDYENNYIENYTTVNLDDFEYVLLSLKDYSQSSAFQTNLQLKGQVGITPIYNYGQTSKDSITGSQVQDRCNISYSQFTSYPFYILQSDLQNNAIYAVKSCSSYSSFKFDNTIFDITYVTQSNLDNPTVVIDGKTYNVIPYADLPSTATKNEADNYIPGAVGGSDGTGGLAGAIKDSQKQLANLWDVFTYFTDYVNQIFNALPPTLANLLISAFALALVLGLIKIFIH